MKKYLLHPACFKLDGGAMFGIIPKPLWSKKIASDSQNRIDMSLRIVLLQTTSKNILIDTGIGDYHGDKFQQNFDIRGEKTHLIHALNLHGLSPKDITDIIITHLHFDHVGGLGNSDQILFPNATIHLHKKHFEYAQNPTVRDAGSFHQHFFMPILNQYLENNKINFLTDESGTILKDGNEEISYKLSFGHTPYMVHPIFEDYIYMADLVPMSHHINVPWVMGYDINPGITTEYKEIFYKFIQEKKLKMIFEHDKEIWGGTLGVDDKNRYNLNESFKSTQEIIEPIS